jgi:hypothetical protein
MRLEPESAPIAVFAYRRTDYLAEVLTALERCPEFEHSRVYVFADGPKSREDRASVEAVRAIIRSRLRPNMTLVESNSNLGIFQSIVGGVTRLCNEFGNVIVIEDDVIVSPVALTWFNRALQRFAENDRVWQISAHQQFVPEFADRMEGIFLPMTTSWGWATWKRAWDRYDPGVSGWMEARHDARVRKRFDLGSSYPYSEVMEEQLDLPSQHWDWDVRFWWNVFSANGVSLFPPRSLARNIGFDEAATHRQMATLRKYFRWERAPHIERMLPRIPQTVIVREEDYEAFRSALGKSRTLFQRFPWLRSMFPSTRPRRLLWR